MRTIKFEGKRIVITGVRGREVTKEIFTLYKSTELTGNTQYITHEGVIFYLTEIIKK